MAEIAVLKLIERHRTRRASEEGPAVGDIQSSVHSRENSKDGRSLRSQGASTDALWPSKFEQLQQIVLGLQQQVMQLQQRSMDSEVLAAELDKLRAEVHDLKSNESHKSAISKLVTGSETYSGLDITANEETEVKQPAAPAPAAGGLGSNLEVAKSEGNEAGITLTLQKLDHHSRGCAIEESMWDAVLFMGFDCIGLVDSLVIFFGAFTSMLIELSFVLVVFANYTQPALNEDGLNALLHWRSVVAHDIAHFDPASQTSLASRVCAQELSTERSGLQMDMYGDVHGFRTSPVQELQHMNGFYLCNLALVLWFFSILHDLTDNYRRTIAIYGFPRGPASLMEFGDTIEIISLNRMQVILYCCLVTIPRMAIAIFLGYAGLYFLAYCSNVGDLLLNAVALVFVLEIDEQLFGPLLPQRVKRVMRMVEPLHFSKHPSQTAQWFKFLCESLRVRFCIVLILMVMCNIWIMEPFNAQLDKALELLCSGRKDVLVYRNPVSGLLMWSEAPSFDFDQAHRMTYRKRAILELIGVDPSNWMDKVGDLPDADKYQNSSVKMELARLARLSRGTTEYVSTTMLCIDHTNLKDLEEAYHGKSTSEWYQSTELSLRAALGKPSFHDCAQLDFYQHCMAVGKLSLTRALCPRVCGCDNPWSGQLFASGANGCPSSCSPRWTLNLYYLAPPEVTKYTETCEDVPVSILEGSDYWRHYAYGVKSYMATFEPEEFALEVEQALLNSGCGYLTQLRFYLDVCKPSAYYRTARAFCPATCMCGPSNLQECPDSCSMTLPHQEMGPGIPCPSGLQIFKASECEAAADEILHQVHPIDGYISYLPSGCYLSHGKVYLSNETDYSEKVIPRDYTALCKTAQPFLPNDVSRGKFSLGKTCAACILNGSSCAQELKCYGAGSVYSASSGSASSSVVGHSSSSNAGSQSSSSNAGTSAAHGSGSAPPF